MATDHEDIRSWLAIVSFHVWINLLCSARRMDLIYHIPLLSDDDFLPVADHDPGMARQGGEEIIKSKRSKLLSLDRTKR